MKKTAILILISSILLTSVCSLFFSACDSGQKQEKGLSFDSITNEINTIANEINAMMMDTTEKFHEGLKKIEIDGKVGFIDTLGNVVIEPQFDGAGCFNEGLVSVTIGSKRESYVTRDGDTETALVGGKMGFIDRTGKYVVEPIYDYCNYFSQGVAVVAKDGKWGYIDKTGKEVIALQFDRAMDFWDANGFAAVCKDGKWGLIDISGQIVVPLEHKDAFSTQKGEACVFPFDENIICYHIYNDGRVMVESIK